MKTYIRQLINSVSIGLMLFFALPKLLGKPQSVAGFNQFEQAIGLNADFFRLFTGISELSLAVLILIFALKTHKMIGKIAYGALLLTMGVALGLEFFARPEPKYGLVIIAIVLALLSIFQLKTITNQQTRIPNEISH